MKGTSVTLLRSVAAPRLLALLAKRNEMVRGLAIQILGDLDRPWSRNALESLIEPPAARQWQAWRAEIEQALGRAGKTPE